MFKLNYPLMEEAEELPQGGGDESLLSGQEATEPQETPTGVEKPDYLLDKYMADGRSVEEAMAEQAKGYGELQKRFGAFTGSPEDYELSVSEELQEAGINLEADDPLVKEALAFAKESNMSQEGFNKMVGLYAEQQLADHTATQEYKAEQMKELGANATTRIQSINDWGNKNLDPETFQSLQMMANSAESVKAIEQLIGMTRSKSVDVDNSQNAGGFGVEDLRSMQFEKDQHGNRKLQTDPEFRKRYNAMASKIYPGEHKQVVG